MGKLIRVQSKRSKEKTLKDSRNVISSQELVAGHLQQGSLESQIAAEFGHAPVPVPRSPSLESKRNVQNARVRILSRALGELASLSAADANMRGSRMKGTCYLKFTVCYAKPDPIARSLENRLRARLVVYGSQCYALRWKSWTMVLGARICALRASEKITSDNEFTGWPTSMAVNWKGKPGKGLLERGGRKSDLNVAVELLTGWVSLTGMDSRRGHLPKRDHDKGHPLSQQVHMLAGWGTPTERDWKDGASDLTNTEINGLLGRQVSLSCVAMENGEIFPSMKKASLNPYFSLWLMLGPFAIVWARCAERVMPLTRNSRRNSCKLD